MMSDWDRENLDKILTGYGTWFNAKLLRLISDADQPSRVLLHKGFPEQVEAVHRYQTGYNWDRRNKENDL